MLEPSLTWRVEYVLKNKDFHYKLNCSEYGGDEYERAKGYFLDLKDNSLVESAVLSMVVDTKIDSWRKPKPSS